MKRNQHIIRCAVAFGLVGLTLASCGLPRSGPTRGEILEGANEMSSGIHVVNVTDAVAEAARSMTSLGFDSAFLNAPASRADRIAAGDTLSVTVWENVDNGLLASVGQKVTQILEIQVDQNGMIFMPYAGNIRAAGKTPEEVRRIVTEKLAGQTPDPQVEVRRLAGDGSTISIIGGVAAPGVYPIEASTRRLLAMLSRAGGVMVEPDVAQIRVQRRGKTGSIWLQDLYDNDLANIALRAGDRIIIEEDRRNFTALGAAGMQKRVPFTQRSLNVLEALAEVGGLNATLADPKGIFVFRDEPSFVANRVLGRTDILTPQRFAYVVDLTQPTGMFIARDFNVRDGDTVYITEAPFVAWNKIITATVGSLGAVDSVVNTADILAN